MSLVTMILMTAVMVLVTLAVSRFFFDSLPPNKNVKANGTVSSLIERVMAAEDADDPSWMADSLESEDGIDSFDDDGLKSKSDTGTTGHR